MGDNDVTTAGGVSAAALEPTGESSAEQLQSLVDAHGADRVTPAVLALLRTKTTTIPVILVQGPYQGGVEMTGGRGYLAIPWPMPPQAAMQVVGHLMTSAADSDTGSRGAPTVTGLTITSAGTADAQQRELQARLERYIAELDAARLQEIDAAREQQESVAQQPTRSGADDLLRAARLILLATVAVALGMTRTHRVTGVHGLGAVLGLSSKAGGTGSRSRPLMGIDLDGPGAGTFDGGSGEAAKKRRP